LQSLRLLFLKYSAGLLLGLSHLLVQYLLLFVLKLRQVLSLFLDHLLAYLLFLFESLLFPILLELIDTLPLLRVVLLALAVLVLLLGELQFIGLELLIRVVELVTSARLLGLALHLLNTVLLQFFEGLALHQLTLEDLLLVLFNVLHLRLVKLVLNNFGSFLFALVHLLKSLVHFTVIVLHLELIIFNPALFHLVIMLFASLL
jgi:hypothetical protein